MATWVTHLMIADSVLEAVPWLDRRGFCVGNIAPDCNMENEDWTAFTPPREVTHWMQGERKIAADCERFFDEYIASRRQKITSNEELSFLLGYYCHLLTDAAYQIMLRDEIRVRGIWRRIHGDAALSSRAAGLPETFDAFKQVVPKKDRLAEIYAVEAKYLQSHPDSGYITEILPLKSFPDYIDYLPTGAIVRKIGVMGTLPQWDGRIKNFVSIDEEEYGQFVGNTAATVVGIFKAKGMGEYDIIL